MKYQVILAPSFRDDLDHHVEYLLAEKVATTTIERWLSDLNDKVNGLDELPTRFPVDPIQSEAIGRETRKLLVGDYLVFYQVDEEHGRVNVVAFVHGARRREA